MTTNKLSAHTPYDKILLATAERLGDALFCTPGIHLLKRSLPHVQLDVLTFGEAAAAVFANNPDVGKVHIATQKSFIPLLTKAYPLTINLMYEMQKHLQDVQSPLLSIAFPDQRKHRAEEVISFVSSLLETPEPLLRHQYGLYPQDTHFAQIQQLLAEHRYDHSQSILIGLQLGCHRIARRGWKFWDRKRHQHQKVWPLEYYVALAQKLSDAFPQVRILLTGAKGERFLGRQFCKEVPSAIDLIGKTEILGMAALMDKIKVLVTHDTGTLHVACARGTPLVSLFGPTLVNFTGPYPILPQHTILHKPQMEHITVDEVYAAVVEKL